MHSSGCTQYIYLISRSLEIKIILNCSGDVDAINQNIGNDTIEAKKINRENLLTFTERSLGFF